MHFFSRDDQGKFWFLSSDLYMMETSIAGGKRKISNKYIKIQAPIYL